MEKLTNQNEQMDSIQNDAGNNFEKASDSTQNDAGNNIEKASDSNQNDAESIVKKGSSLSASKRNPTITKDQRGIKLVDLKNVCSTMNRSQNQSK